MENLEKQKPRICFLFFNDFWPTATILTIRLMEEKEEDVHRCLTKAFSALPFSTSNFLVRFQPPFEGDSLLKNLEIDRIIDRPGAPMVTLTLSVDTERSFFLPRDPETGEFIKIEDQIRCLSVITPRRVRERWKDWFEEQKRRLEIKE